MDIVALNHPIDAQTAAAALADAAATAGYAPSIHNTQPWRWRLTGNTIDLHLVHSRVLQVSDPDGRLATLSCGAALHHARITMAARGWRITVARMLQDGDRDLVARIQVHNRSPVDPVAATLLQTVPSRQTGQRSVGADTAVDPEDLSAVTTAIEAQDTRSYTLRPDQLLELAAAADHARRSQAADPAWQAELSYWTGPALPGGSGIPGRSTKTTVTVRDSGRHDDMPISVQHDKAAVFVVLHGGADEPLNWLRAGEGLSAGWLTATGHGVSLVPHSAPIETIATRQAMRAMIASTGYPYLVLRLAPAAASPPRTPRLPAAQIIERY